MGAGAISALAGITVATTPTRPYGKRESGFELELNGPFEPGISLEMFRRSGDDLLDRWDGSVFVRTIAVENGRQVAFACEFSGTLERPIVRVTVEDSRYAGEIERSVRGAFVCAPQGFSGLARGDAVVAALDQRYRGLRPVLQSNLLSALIRCISAQQVNLRWAATCRRRLTETFGRRHHVDQSVVYSLDPARLAELTIADIRALQFTNRKAEYIINVAKATVDGQLSIERLSALADDDVVAALVPIRGIGRWTAEWVLARTLGRPRVVGGDLGVRKAVGLAYFGGRMPSEAEVRAATMHWGASAAVVQALILHALAEKTLAPNSSAVISLTTSGEQKTRRRRAREGAQNELRSHRARLNRSLT
ncbi:MAG: DNA-3-methyladenine glycosylase family protein [Candidatus Binataceae bacterium]